MKKLIFSVFIILSISINAQITKGKVYSGSKVAKQSIIDSDLKTFILDKTVSSTGSGRVCSVSILNSNGSNYSSCSPVLETKPSDSQTAIHVLDFGGFAKNAYNLGDKVYFWLTYSWTYSSYTLYSTNIVDEKGITILKIDSCDKVNLYGNESTGFNLITHNGIINNYTIYSLPGKGKIDTLTITKFVYVYDTITVHKKDTTFTSNNTIIQDNNPTIINTPNSDLLLKPFPNPSSSFINIPYQISNNGSLKIYNSIGVMINSFIILNSSNSLIIDISKYSNGVYGYKIFDGVNSVSSGKFNKN